MSKQQRSELRVLTWETAKRVLSEGRYRAALERAAAECSRPIVTPDDAIRGVVAALQQNPRLGACNVLSFVQAGIASIRTGLPIGKPLDLAYLVTRWNRDLGDWAYFVPSYMGLLAIVDRANMVSAVWADAVREGDEYDLVKGSRPSIAHRHGATRGRVVAAYAVAYRPGCKWPIIADLDEAAITARMSMSESLKSEKSAKFSPWTCWPAEMAAGKAIAKLTKFLPRIPELAFAQQAGDLYDSGEMDASALVAIEEATGQRALPEPATVTVVERVAERAALASTASASAPDLDGGHIGPDGARALVSQALNAVGRDGVERWSRDVMDRHGVGSLADLDPNDATRIEAELRAAIEASL